MEHIKYPSIGQFRNAVYQINRTYNYIGLDENEEPIYDPSKSKPTLKFKGTVKLHGTNASVCYNEKDGIWYQSRKRIITPQQDNAGFAMFAEKRKDIFMEMFNKLSLSCEETITIFGEWAGQGIQKTVAISLIPKSFFILGIKVGEYWLDCGGLRSIENRIYNIEDYKSFEIEVDFNNPELAQNEIIKQTLSVEEECPVAKSLGHEGTGEGIVYSCYDNGTHYPFKSKGEKHSKSKVKTLKVVDSERINKINELAEKVTPVWRLEQFLNEVCNLNNGGEITRDKISPFIRAVIEDIFKEELDVISKSEIESKELGKPVSTICRNYFFEQEKI